jgi:hypothetical protein
MVGTQGSPSSIFASKRHTKTITYSRRGNAGMHKRWVIFLTVVLTGLILLAAGLPRAQEQESPKWVVIENEGYKRKAFKPISFTHEVHAEDYGVECTECHHDYKEGENVWKEGDPVLKCVVCHNPQLKQGEVDRLLFAFHFNCKGCHKLNEMGPIDCNECHAKKK